MFSARPDGERVGVVGEDPPGDPGSDALVAFESAALEPVASFQVADPALAADPEARETAIGALGAGGLSTGDEDTIRARQVLGDAGGKEAAVERELAWPELERVELRGRLGQEVGLVQRADPARGGDGQPAGAAAGVLAELGELDDIAELGRRPQLALADRTGMGSLSETSRSLIFSPASRLRI